jgi:glycosyltransferase involved in cell wall biosynthesis
MFYILQYAYTPNTASCNRLLGFYKTLDAMGIEATIVHLAPNEDKSKIKDIYNHLHLEYNYNGYLPYKKFIKKILVLSSLRNFVKRLHTGDIVYTYQISKLTLACQGISGVKVYAEMTEHPDACMCVADPSILLNKEEFIKCVCSLDGLFVISRPLKSYFTFLGLDESKIQIINMTVDENRFSNVEKQLGAERYIAYCGTASNTKDGVDELIKAFSIVHKKIPDVFLYIIGKTPRKDERFSNMELVKELGIEDVVRFTGALSSDKIPQMLKDAEILALARPSNLQSTYGFPTKLGEYLLTKNIVVITSVGDIPFFLEDKVSALIAPPSDTKEFANKLIWALQNKNKAKMIGEEGCRVAQKNFTSRVEGEKMVRFMGLLNDKIC